MSERKWTRNQEDAINARRGSILVSAAAGSGKTAVLVQRVIELITDRENPVDADKLLVVTFTNAAAKEMKQRISAKIAELLIINPNDNNLRRQQILLAKAHISTIHSFCNEIIRDNFHKLNITSDFRIADSNEILILKDVAIKLTLEKFYKEKSQNFINMVETFSSGRDDSNLISTIYRLYSFISAHPFKEKWLDDKIQQYKLDQPIGQTVWGKVIFEYAENLLDYCINLTQNSINLSKEDAKLLEAYGETLSLDLILIKELKQDLKNKTWDDLYNQLNSLNFANLKPLRGYAEDEYKIKISENRKSVKDSITSLKKIIDIDEKGCKEDLATLLTIIQSLFEVLKDFMDEFSRLKIERNILDFSDLEHFAIKLLVEQTEGGFEKTTEAIELSKHFAHVMVDEYQDTNEAQDVIFRAISNEEKNLFVVGDVKQSIYRFRQAMPEIFIRRKASYEKYQRDLENYPARIILDSNFRSRSGVTDAVNFVFKQIMSRDVGDMDYDREEELVAAANFEKRFKNPEYSEDSKILQESIDENVLPDVTLDIIDLDNRNDEENMDVIEARHIANVISKMISEGHLVKDGGVMRKATYKDFCILLRSANVHSYDFVQELEECGIPAWSDSSSGFLDKTEIATIISMLRVIDNPIQDVPLLAVLMSPLFGFTPDDVALIRCGKSEDKLVDESDPEKSIKDFYGKENKKVPLYFSLKNKADAGDERCKEVVNEIDSYRYLAATMPCYRLINYIYDRTSFIAIVQAMKQGQVRLANLRLLVEYTKGFDSSGHKSLSDFVRFIDRLQKQGSDLNSAVELAESADVVRVMSIHRSKGLEFPICIIANCARKFNKDRIGILLHSDLGPGIKIRNLETLHEYTNFVRSAVSLEIDKDAISEELRILYVAMTRAKENLIMVCSLNNPYKKISSLASSITQDQKISPYVVRNASSFSDWILSCAIRHPSAKKLREIDDLSRSFILQTSGSWEINFVCIKDKQEKEEQAVVEETQEYDEVLLENLEARFSYNYPLKRLERIPAITNVSKLVDEQNLNLHSDKSNEKLNYVSDDESYKHAFNENEIMLSRPRFLKESNMNSAEVGSAVHAFMQFMNFKMAKEDVSAHMEYLKEKGFLAQHEVDAIDVDMVSSFLNSDLGERVINAGQVWREYKFGINVSASEFDNTLSNELKKEQVIIHGAIDCLFEEDDKFIIIDYKTDRTNSIDELVNRHYLQLNLYKRAIEECTGKEVAGCFIYSFYLGKAIML